MSAPDELRQLADRLDEYADDMDSIERSGGFSAGDPDDDRAAAVALRHHANLLDVIGDPDELRTMVAWLGSNSVEEDRTLARRVADIADAAAVSPPPAPTTCPTERLPMPRTCQTCGMSADDDYDHCPDPWHQETT